MQNITNIFEDYSFYDLNQNDYPYIKKDSSVFPLFQNSIFPSWDTHDFHYWDGITLELPFNKQIQNKDCNLDNYNDEINIVQTPTITRQKQISISVNISKTIEINKISDSSNFKFSQIKESQNKDNNSITSKNNNLTKNSNKTLEKGNIFKTSKMGRRRRRRKNKDLKYEIESHLYKEKISSKHYHGKYSSDNIKRKIKNKFLNNVFDFISISFKYEKTRTGRIKPVLRKIDNKIWLKVNNFNNFFWLNKTVKDLYLVKVRKKYKSDKDELEFYNIKVINKILKENKEKKVIEILGKTVREIYEIYLGIKIDNSGFYDDFTKLEDELLKNEYKKENEKFLEIYRENAKKLLINAKERKEGANPGQKNREEKMEIEIEKYKEDKENGS